MRAEVAAGPHPVLQGEHLVAMLAGDEADAAAAALAPALAAALDLDDVRASVDALPESVDLAVLHVAGTYARGILRGKRLAIKADRTDGAVVLYGAPARPRSTVITETECAAIEVLDVAADRDAALDELVAARGAASRLVVRRIPSTEALAPAPEPARRALARLAFAGGTSVDVDTTVVLGRSPRVPRTEGLRLPRVVALPSAGPAVSRSHVRIAVDDGLLTIEDLDSRNGTAVVDPTGGSRRLEAGDRVPLVDGMVVTIAEDLAFRVVAS